MADNTVMLKINQDALSLFIRTHLNSHYQETLTTDVISKLIEQIVDSFDYFINRQTE